MDKPGDIHTESLAVFASPPINSSIERLHYIHIRSSNQLDRTGPLHFVISGSSNEYIDLSRTQLYVKLKVVKKVPAAATTSSLALPDLVSLINIPVHTIWSQVDITLNGTPLSSDGVMYPYKAYLNTILKRVLGEEPAGMDSELFHLDDFTQMIYPVKNKPAGQTLPKALEVRSANVSKIIDVQGPLQLDICNQKRLILNGVRVVIKLWPQNDNFCLLAEKKDVDYRIEILDASLKVCFVALHPKIIVAHEALLKQNKMALYPYYKNEMRLYTVPNGQYNVTLDNMFQGRIPTAMYVMLVKAAAYNGDLHMNPFKAEHLHMDFARLTVNGVGVPDQGIKPNFENGIQTYVGAYRSLIDTVRDNEGHYPIITRQMYGTGYTILGYNIDPSGDFDGRFFAQSKVGHLRLELVFNQPIPESINVIVYATFPDMMKIDAARNVIR